LSLVLLIDGCPEHSSSSTEVTAGFELGKPHQNACPSHWLLSKTSFLTFQKFLQVFFLVQSKSVNF
jgi:hypothetical protein